MCCRAAERHHDAERNDDQDEKDDGDRSLTGTAGKGQSGVHVISPGATIA